ncbi:hypothetical protein L7F22_018983 [Adiantum nelumboides]|nr:hypothetical protein [Adiantum nelumboides]
MAPSPKQGERKYDVVLFGATGFTGKLVATYLNSHSGKPKWAMAGRSKERIEKVRKELQIDSKIEIIEANNTNIESLHSLAKQTRCVINVVGPFRLLGAEELVKACIAEGTHYVDLSGETGFNESLIKNHHESAKKAGVIITPSVGLDSLPSDISTYLAVQHLKNVLHAPGAEEVIVALKEAPIFSTGTVHSACDMVDEDKTQLQFCDEDRLATRKPVKPMSNTAAIWLPQFNAYGGGYVLSPHNVRTVYRSWSLLEDAAGKDSYGANFTYEDTLLGGSWAFSQVQNRVQVFANLLLNNLPPIRWALRKALPTGGGPSVGMQNRVKTDARAWARYGQKQAISTFKAPGDPGYKMTARMISEVALATALDHDKLHPLAKEGGILTAATTGANIICERLEKYADFEVKTETFSEP